MKSINSLSIAMLIASSTAAVALPADGHTLYNPVNITSSRIDSLSLEQDIPLNPKVKVGQLKNGFQYFIIRNEAPENRVFIHLLNKVGSLQETEKERGLAHFMEHMNFNGLKHFPKNSVIDYLQTFGVKFGGDLNAHTGYEETIYKLKIPADQPALLKSALQITRDWAQDATMEDEEINKERGVIIEEMRGLRNAEQRMREQYYAPILNYSQYATRAPIGLEEIVKNFDPKLLKDFHKNWYRPDLQALVVVGDMDEAAIEKEIIRLFSDLKNPKNAPALKEYALDLSQENKYVVTSDPEASRSSGEFLFKFSATNYKKVGDHRHAILRSAFNKMIGDRMNELKEKYKTSFSDIGIKHERFIGNADIMRAFFNLRDGNFKNGFEVVYTELLRLKQHGFTQEELDRFIDNQQKLYANYYANRERLQSAQLVQSITDYYFGRGTGADVLTTYQMATQILPTITLEDVNGFYNEIIKDWKYDILIQSHDNWKKNIPSEAEFKAVLSQVQPATLKPYVREVLDLPILSKEPLGGSILSESFDKENQLWEFKLSNGAKVYVRKSKFKPQQILFSAISPGGTTLVSDKDYPAALQTASIIAASGVGRYSESELKKYLIDKKASITPYLREHEEAISGTADSAGLKTMFQMLYGYFVEPRLDDASFNTAKATTISVAKNGPSKAQSILKVAVQQHLFDGHLRRSPLTVEMAESISKEQVFEIYTTRFSNAADFTFTLVGDIDIDALRPLLAQYVASLPASSSREKAKDLQIRHAKKPAEIVIHKSKEAKTNVQLVYAGDFDYTLKEKATMNALGGVLRFMMMSRLREDEAGVYGANASVGVYKDPMPSFKLYIIFDSNVEQTPSLIKAALEEVQKVKKDGPSQDLLNKYIMEQKLEFESSQDGNYFFINAIESELKGDLGLTELGQQYDLLDKLTVKSVQDIAKKYLKDEKLFKFILMPENKQ